MTFSINKIKLCNFCIGNLSKKTRGHYIIDMSDSSCLTDIYVVSKKTFSAHILPDSIRLELAQILRKSAENLEAPHDFENAPEDVKEAHKSYRKTNQ